MINLVRRGNISKEERIIKSEIDKRKLVSLIISVIFALLSIATVVTMIVIDVLPFKYLIALILGLLVINTLLDVILIKNRKGKKARNIINVLQVLGVIVICIINIYAIKTYRLIDGMNDDVNKKMQNYSVLVLNDSEYKEIKDLDGKVIEYYSSDLDNSDLALNKLKEVVKVSAVSNEDVFAVGKTLLSSGVDAILLEDSQKQLLEDELESFKDKVKVIYTFSIDVDVQTIAKNAEVTSDTFILYLSGIDTYGKISSVSRSDVNIVAVVNPKTYQVLLVNIPRDYYVQLHGTTGKRDKLTHAGMYGVEKSVQTIEDLLDIDINYYFKVNFTSVIDIVNAIGGIEVYSEYDFVSYIGKYKFKKGYNSVNGEQALAFARERKSFAAGDRMRGKNQQAVIDAIIKKASKPSIITKYDSLLKSFASKFQTNMSTEKMMELAKLQISKMPTWNVSTISLTGGDGHASTYSGGSQLLYVMYPSQNSINDVKAKIKAVIDGETLEASYSEVTGNVYVPTKAEVEATPIKEVVEEEKVEETEVEDLVQNNENTETNQNENNNSGANENVDPYSENN